MEDKILFQLGDGAFWLSIFVGSMSVVVLWDAWRFAVWVKGQDALVLGEKIELKPGSQLIAQYLENRTEFWLAFGQIIVAVLLIAVLAILLITKTINAEAGLPILSAIAGFAIAKGVSLSRSGPAPAASQPNPPAAKQPVQPSPTGSPPAAPATDNNPEGATTPITTPTSPNNEPAPSPPEAERGNWVGETQNKVIVGSSVVPKKS
jgi:hypothetical protein